MGECQQHVHKIKIRQLILLPSCHFACIVGHTLIGFYVTEQQAGASVQHMHSCTYALLVAHLAHLYS